MKSIVQGVIGSLITALIIGVLAYAFLVRENQIKIGSLKDQMGSLKNDLVQDLEDAEQKLDKNSAEITDIKLLIAKTFPSREFFSVKPSGKIEKSRVAPIESAVIVSAANVVAEIKNVGESDNEESIKQLEKAREEYETLLALARENNPGINNDLKSFRVAKAAESQSDEQLSDAHRELSEIDKAVRATTGISVEDIQKHGIMGGQNSEVRRASKAISEVFGW